METFRVWGALLMNTVFLLSLVVILLFLFYTIAKKNHRAKRLFSYLAIGVLFAYIVWRGVCTLPLDNAFNAIGGVILYLAEIMGLFVFAFFVIMFGRQKIEEGPPELADSFRPKVCVFVCTYNEDIKLVLATAHAAKMLEYPNKEIYICDDGHRERLRELCFKFGIGYLSRPDNAHAKAGNINYALSQTKSELFMVLDADFIVKKNFIYEALPYFQDEKTALVQYPQTFYNKDPFQLMKESLYNEQELFMRFLEPVLAGENALIHVGTNAVLRRSAVERIGGIPVKSITEDMATGLLLQNEGYRTCYVNKPYALGITPYNVSDLASQRRRWARGTMQIFRNYKPYRMGGLSLLQKACYFNSYLYWFTSFQKLVYMVAPTLFMMFQIFIVKSDLRQTALFFVIPVIMIILSFRLYIPKVRTFSTSHMYDSFVAPIHAGAILAEFFREEKTFRVTKKEVSVNIKFDAKTVKVHIGIALWIVAALVCSVFQIVKGTPFVYGYIITSGWSLYNLYGLIRCILAAKSRKIISDADALSITIDEDVMINNEVFHAFQFSYNGFRVYKKHGSLASFFTQGEMYMFETVRTGLVVSARCIEIHEYAAFSFENLSPEAADRLAVFYSEKLHAAKPCCI